MFTEKKEAEQLSLFEGRGVDLTRLRLARTGLSGSAVCAPGTVKAYSYDWQSFEQWCRDAGREAMPASTDTVSLYVTWLLTEQRNKVATAERRVAAITRRHRDQSQPLPVTPAVRDIMTAVRRERKEQPEGKAALDLDDFVRVARRCDGSTVAGVRDRALVVLGFATSLRRSELGRLQISDIAFQSKGVAVMVRYSKTDQEGRGRLIGVWAGKRAVTDPVRVLKAWIIKRGKWEGPLFCRVSQKDQVVKKSLSGDSICHVVQRAISRAGLDSSEYGAHSLRAGAITASAELARTTQELKRLSGHRDSRMIDRYVRSARLYTGRNPLAGAM